MSWRMLPATGTGPVLLISCAPCVTSLAPPALATQDHMVQRTALLNFNYVHMRLLHAEVLPRHQPSSQPLDLCPFGRRVRRP